MRTTKAITTASVLTSTQPTAATYAQALANVLAKHDTLPELVWQVHKYGVTGTAHGDSFTVVAKVQAWAAAFGVGFDYETGVGTEPDRIVAYLPWAGVVLTVTGDLVLSMAGVTQ